MPDRRAPSRRTILALAAGASLARPALAQAPAYRLRFTLDWAFQGPSAPWVLADRLGFYRDEGLEVRVDAGQGSADTLQRVAGGSYDIALSDLGAMIAFDARNRAAALTAVMVMHDRSSVAIMALRPSGIMMPADLRGRAIAAPEADAGRLLWPAFARANSLPLDAVQLQSVAPQLRESLLLRGGAAAMTGLTISGIGNLLGLGVPREDITVLRYADHGVPLYGHALMLRPEFAAREPAAVAGFLRATTRALRASRADPDAAIAALRVREGLIDPVIERARLALAFEEVYLTPRVLRDGFGEPEPDRLRAMIAAMADAFALPNPPSPELVFDGRYLPPATARRLA